MRVQPESQSCQPRRGLTRFMNVILPKRANQLFDKYPYLVFGLILFSQDSYEYLRFSRRLAEFFITGRNPGDYFWPVNFPLLGAILSLIIKSNIFSLQLVSILSFVFAAFYTVKLISLLYPDSGKESYLYLTLFLCLSPFFFRGAFLVMSDMLAVFLTTAAIFHFLKYHRSLSRSDFFLTIFFAASAAMTRYASAVVLTLPGVLLAISFFRGFRFADLLLGLLIIAFCFSPHLLIKGANSTQFIGHEWLQSWSIKNWFLSEFTTVDGYQNYRFPNLLYGFSNFYHPGFFFMGIILLFFLQRKAFHQRENFVLIATTVLYALFLAGIPFQNMRFLLLTFPLAIITIFPLFQRFRHKILIKNGLVWSFAALIIFIQFALIYRYSSGIYQANQIEREIARTVLTYRNRPIYTFAIDGALRCYGVDSDDIVNIWYSRLDSVKISSLVLFSEGKFKRQWEGRNPMINWQFIQRNYNLKKIETLPEGWELYQVKGKAF